MPTTPTHSTQILREAEDAGLTPLLARIACILADVEGLERAHAFILEVCREGELKALRDLMGSSERGWTEPAPLRSSPFAITT